MHLRDLLRLSGVAFAAAITAASSARAADAEAADAEKAFPYVSGSAYLELGDDWTFQSDDSGSEIHDVYFYGTLDLQLHLAPVWSVNLGLTGEDVKGDYVPDEDRFFKDTGVYVHALNVQADLGGVTLLAGKFHPNFGRAWDNTPGVFGTYFAEDYELTEMDGVSASYTLATDSAGSHTIGIAGFFADTTFLSDSIFTRRGRKSVDDGGLANTGKLNNFVVSLDGSEIPSLEGFSYHLAYSHLAAGATEDLDQNAFVAGVAQDITIDDNTSVSLTAEAAFLDNYTGFDGDATYLTVGGAVYRGSWHGELSGSWRRYPDGAGSNYSDQLLQVSGGYTFDNGFDLAAGYGFTHAADLDYHTIGLRLTRSFDFPSKE